MNALMSPDASKVKIFHSSVPFRSIFRRLSSKSAEVRSLPRRTVRALTTNQICRVQDLISYALDAQRGKIPILTRFVGR